MTGPGNVPVFAPIWQAGGWLASARRVVSPNFGERPVGMDIKLVVIHSISLPPEEFGGPWVEQLFTNCLDCTIHPYFETLQGVEVSAHFFLRRDGEVIQFVGCDRRAWHAGRSSWQGRENCNDFSVGIELEGSSLQNFTAAQYAALWPLLEALRLRYPITAVVGHEHVAPGRKSDPGPGFDWAAVAEHCPGLQLPSAGEEML